MMSRLINPIIHINTQVVTIPSNKRAVREQHGGRAEHAQGMVEFALVLPLLLLLIFGIMELGRLMIIYTGVHAASREGGRYGSAAGLSDTCLPFPCPYYLDEVGIRAAAQRIAVLVGADVEPIIWDDGQGNEFDDADEGSDISLGDRVIVSVVARYEPLLGLTPLQGFDIRSTTRRTIVKEVAIGPSGHTGGGPTDNAPYVNIETPTCPLNILEPATLNLTAVAGDVEDGDLTSAIVWYLDGSEYGGCSGGSCSMPGLPPGNHTVLAEVTDSDDRTGVHDCEVYVDPMPVVIITSPADGTSFVEGYPITFSATASELSPGDLNGSIQWTSHRDGNIGSGPSFSIDTLSLGEHQITATATDGDLQVGSDTITIHIDPIIPTQLIIVSPIDEAHFPEGSRIDFRGYATDDMRRIISSSIVWSSVPAGVSGVGALITTGPMVRGDYEVYASVPATGMNVSITVHIDANEPPTLRITSPVPSFIARPGDSITFSATATDDLYGNISDQIEWSSDSGEIDYTGANFQIATLSEGTHRVTATVTDPINTDSTVSVWIEVRVLNPPTVTITAPVNNANLRWNTPNNFTGIATNYDGSTFISNLIQWTSSIDGDLGTEGSISVTLSAGTHTIMATVTDPYTGFSSSTSILVSVWQTICPTSGSTTWAPDRRYLTWQLIIPAQTPLDSVLSSLRLVMNNTTATVSSVTVNGQTVFSSPAGAGSPVNVPGPRIWSGNYPSSSYTLPVVFYFAQRPSNNIGTFNLQATFEGCSTILQASTTP